MIKKSNQTHIRVMKLWCLSDEAANNNKKMISFISENFLGNQTPKQNYISV